MPFNVRHNHVGPIEGETVSPALQHDELRAWEQLRQPLADRHGTDRIGVSPQQEDGSRQLSEPGRQVFALIFKPRRQLRIPGSKRAPREEQL